jgi:hypothetical protein
VTATVSTVEVDRAASEVFAYATDPTRFREWQQGVVDGRMDSAEQPSVGDRCHTTRRIGGANRSSTSMLTHVDPPRTWVCAVSTARSAPRSTSPSNPSPTPEAVVPVAVVRAGAGGGSGQGPEEDAARVSAAATASPPGRPGRS